MLKIKPNVIILLLILLVTIHINFSFAKLEISPTSTMVTGFECKIPSCIGASDTGKTDSNNCPIFICSITTPPSLACSMPICNGAYDTGRVDANGCKVYSCPSVACSKPICDGAYDTGTKDANNCTIYSCPSLACGSPICKDGSSPFDTGSVDSNGCKIYSCPSIACTTCVNGTDTGKFDSNNCPIFLCPGTTCSSPICKDDSNPFDTGFVDSKGCTIYSCPSTTCTTCIGGTDTGEKDTNGCPVFNCPISIKTCPDNCTCSDNQMSCPTNAQKPIEIEMTTSGVASTVQVQKTLSGNIEITKGVSSVQTSSKIVVDEKKLYMQTSQGQNEIKILPDAAKTIAAEQLQLSNLTMELRDSGKAVYDISGTKNAKLFGFINVGMPVNSQIDATTGTIMSVNSPWWGFLTF